MNTRMLLLASLLGGLTSVVLVNLPIINLVNCLICAGFWAGPLLAVWFYRRQTSAVTLGQAIGIGVAAGAWHAVFGLLLSLVGLAGAQALATSFAQLAPAESGAREAMSGVEASVFNVFGVLTDLVFGAIGGVIGGALFRDRPAAPVTQA